MDVLVTGGTGFVGACLVGRLLDAGHQVSLLVRRPDQIDLSLRPWGHGRDDLTAVVVGDVRDPDAVGTALDGCDAVVHAAAVYSVDSRRYREVLDTNERAAEVVLGNACERGLDPVVHISSTVALLRVDGSGPDLPLGDIDMPYAHSKRASEEVARRLQAEGRPVVCVYPGGVLGPHDPYRGDQSERLRWQARGIFPLFPRGGMHMVDVRTVADVVLAVLEPGRGPRRYVVPGTHADAAAFYRALATVQGRRRPFLAGPAGLLRPMTRSLDVLQRRLPGRLHVPTDPEGVEIMARDTRLDDSPARNKLGVQPVPFVDSVRDTVAWLVADGRLSPRLAPRGRAPV